MTTKRREQKEIRERRRKTRKTKKGEKRRAWYVVEGVYQIDISTLSLFSANKVVERVHAPQEEEEEEQRWRREK